MPAKPSAAIVTVGTELVTGQRLDTNGAEIASAMLVGGFEVVEMLSVADDTARLALHLKRLTNDCAVVIVTGGLGPTHDVITRDAESQALGKPLLRDASIEDALARIVSRHRDPGAAEQVLRQADIIEDAVVIAATTGTAPGQIIPTPAGYLVLLPGPPSEMRPMLARFLEAHGSATTPVRLRSSGIPESDAQLTAQRILGGRVDVGLTVLAAPADVEVVLFDEGAGAAELTRLGELVGEALGDACYSSDGSSMAETVIRLARERCVRIACAESCTGGKIAAALTDVPGSSETFLGGVVAYSNELKIASLGVSRESIAEHGAVSEETARAMAIGAAQLTESAYAVSTTGIAGPTGGTADKPVGLVWFGMCTPSGVSCERREFFGDRTGVRTRATMYALNLLRQALLDDE